MAGEQDGAETVDKARFDSLMGAYQKALTENRTLKGQGGAQAQTDSGDGDGFADLTAQPDSQPAAQWEPGTQLVVGDDGSLEEFEPPTPGRHNESRTRRSDGDDGSAAWLEGQLAAKAGGGKPPAWPV